MPRVLGTLPSGRTPAPALETAAPAATVGSLPAQAEQMSSWSLSKTTRAELWLGQGCLAEVLRTQVTVSLAAELRDPVERKTGRGLFSDAGPEPSLRAATSLF